MAEDIFNQLLAGRRINKNIPLPYYYQIAEALREVIEDADVGSQQGEIAFPSEAELCDIFQVTRGTVRHALEVLEREGLIYRKRGRGTFVARRRVEFDLTRLCSTTDDMRARGWAPAIRLLGIREVRPRPHIRRALRMPQDSAVWEVNRLRLADGEPVSLQWSYLPTTLTPDLDQHDLAGSLYHILRDCYGVELRTADQIIRTRAAAAESAKLLGISEGDPIFVITRTTYDQNDVAVEYLDSLWRGDRYDLQVRRFSRD